MSGWIEPPDPTVSAEYWVTRRSADAAPGHDHGLPDLRVRYRWVPPGLMGTGSWITGYYEGIQRREATLSCLSSANGWRVEPAYFCARCKAPVDDFNLAEAEAEGFDADHCDVLCRNCRAGESP